MAAVSEASRPAGGAILARARRIVVKVGSALLVDPDGRLREEWLAALAEDVARLRGQGRDVILVSSGSIALGRRVLGLKPGPLALEQSQAAAAVGQIRLARAYESALAPHGVIAAQVLVTLEDSENRRRYLNSRATIQTLLTLGAVPIVNENDTVATDEIRFGDNDRLAAQVAGLAGADVLILLSDVDGLYTANPRQDPAARRLDLVEEITPAIEAMAGDAGTAGAKGGMRTKIMAARTAMQAGCAMAITRGDVAHPIRALEQGAPCTWFRAASDPATARKRWIAGMKPRGRIIVDDGAARALGQGRSLLSPGVCGIEGSFRRGDAVDILDRTGRLLARALSGYDAAEMRAVMGRRSSEIAAILGHPGRAAVVHRDDMAILDGARAR
ncbi:MAG: glutamate 5-kinase [Alphaproteobacteria bacterium]|nr:MAG: glutamate 5-kinase [Alphaproteobacteria bacterium]